MGILELRFDRYVILRDSIQMPLGVRLMLATLGLLACESLLAAPPKIEIQGRLRAVEGVVQQTVPPGADLTQGDELRLQVTAADAGYVYVIALGSSGSALVLEPFGGTEPSAVGAGDSRSIPADGGFLPLDDRLGTETFIAFVAPKPLTTVASLLVRLEAAEDREMALRRVLSNAGYLASSVSVGHVAPGAALAARRTTPEIPDASAPAPADRAQVLSGLGGQIAAFRKDGGEREPTAQTAPAEASPDSARSAVSAMESTRAPTPQEAQDSESSADGPSSGFLARLGGWFTADSTESTPESPVPSEERATRKVAPERLQPVVSDERTIAAVPAGDEPALTRERDAAGRRVVRLQGGKSPSAESPGNDAVLSGAGSRIRALLDSPSTETVPQGADAPRLPAPPDPTDLTRTPSPAPASPAAPSVPAGTLQSASGPASVPEANVDSPVMTFDLLSNSGPAGSVVMVVTSQGASSGVLVDNAGHVLTSWHGVAGHDSAVVVFKRDGAAGVAAASRRRARLVAHSKFSDLALLAIESPPAGYRPATLAPDSGLPDGAPIHALGHDAHGTWRHGVAHGARVRRNSSWYSPRRVLHRADVIRAEVREGALALEGPLFNQRLELVGLAAMVRSEKGEVIGIAASTLRAFLKGAS